MHPEKLGADRRHQGEVSPFGPNDHRDPDKVESFNIGDKHKGEAENHAYTKYDAIRELEGVTVDEPGPDEADATEDWGHWSYGSQEIVIPDMLQAILLEGVDGEQSND